MVGCLQQCVRFCFSHSLSLTHTAFLFQFSTLHQANKVSKTETIRVILRPPCMCHIVYKSIWSTRFWIYRIYTLFEFIFIDGCGDFLFHFFTALDFRFKYTYINSKKLQQINRSCLKWCRHIWLFYVRLWINSYPKNYHNKNIAWIFCLFPFPTWSNNSFKSVHGLAK